MSHLSWISDARLCSAVNTLAEGCAKARDEAGTKIHKNVVDPFSCLTVASTFKIQTVDGLLELQRICVNFIGNIHRHSQFSSKNSFFRKWVGQP